LAAFRCSVCKGCDRWNDVTAGFQSGVGRVILREQFARLRSTVHAEKQADLAREFDAIHSVARAKAVGSLDDVIAPEALRPRLIAALG
jgi:hypothetical protein